MDDKIKYIYGTMDFISETIYKLVKFGLPFVTKPVTTFLGFPNADERVNHAILAIIRTFFIQIDVIIRYSDLMLKATGYNFLKNIPSFITIEDFEEKMNKIYNEQYANNQLRSQLLKIVGDFLDKFAIVLVEWMLVLSTNEKTTKKLVDIINNWGKKKLDHNLYVDIYNIARTIKIPNYIDMEKFVADIIDKSKVPFGDKLKKKIPEILNNFYNIYTFIMGNLYIASRL